MNDVAFKILVMHGCWCVFPAQRTNVPSGTDVGQTLLAEMLTAALHEEGFDGDVKTYGADSFFRRRVHQVVLVLVAFLRKKVKGCKCLHALCADAHTHSLPPEMAFAEVH